MKRLILLVALVMAMAVLAPAAFADDDTDEFEGADVEMEEKGPSAAPLWKAAMIAEYFTVTENYVLSLRSGEVGKPEPIGHAVGWGVMYQLMLFGFEPDDYEGGWVIGKLRKVYLEDNLLKRSDLGHNNFGQLHKEEKSAKPDKTMPEQAGKKDKPDS